MNDGYREMNGQTGSLARLYGTLNTELLKTVVRWFPTKDESPPTPFAKGLPFSLYRTYIGGKKFTLNFIMGDVTAELEVFVWRITPHFPKLLRFTRRFHTTATQNKKHPHSPGTQTTCGEDRVPAGT